MYESNSSKFTVGCWLRKKNCLWFKLCIDSSFFVIKYRKLIFILKVIGNIIIGFIVANNKFNSLLVVLEVEICFLMRMGFYAIFA